MTKKLLLAFAFIIFTVCCGVCFAEDGNSNINLGNTITNAIDNTKNGIKDMANDVMDGMNEMTENTIIDDTVTDENVMSSREYTDATYNGYDAYRTDVDGTLTTTDTTMSTTTWIWIILALAAIIIVAMIWYYAVQSPDNRN